jgi:hypothetical protein
MLSLASLVYGHNLIRPYLNYCCFFELFESCQREANYVLCKSIRCSACTRLQSTGNSEDTKFSSLNLSY